MSAVAVGAITGFVFGLATGLPMFGLACGICLGAVIHAAESGARDEAIEAGETWHDNGAYRIGRAVFVVIAVAVAMTAAGLSAGVAARW